jgi:hypothetical protein
VKVALVLACAACSSALQEPQPLSSMATSAPSGRSVEELMHDADAAWEHRGEPGKAARAQQLYIEAANGAPTRSDPVLGAMRALTFRIEYEPGVDKAKLAEQEVDLGQWCQRRDPQNAECDYRLAIALGQEARERTSVGHDAVNRMVELLKNAVAKVPQVEEGGPHRVLAIVLLRAPGWPAGPGDAEAGLAQAKAAVAAFPNMPPNQLTLGEALAANDSTAAAHTAYSRALALATARIGDPEAKQWVAEAREGLAKTSH